MTVTDRKGGPEPGQLLKDFGPLGFLLLDFKTTRWENNKQAEFSQKHTLQLAWGLLFSEVYIAVVRWELLWSGCHGQRLTVSAFSPGLAARGSKVKSYLATRSTSSALSKSLSKPINQYLIVGFFSSSTLVIKMVIEIIGFCWDRGLGVKFCPYHLKWREYIRSGLLASSRVSCYYMFECGVRELTVLIQVTFKSLSKAFVLPGSVFSEQALQCLHCFLCAISSPFADWLPVTSWSLVTTPAPCVHICEHLGKSFLGTVSLDWFPGLRENIFKCRQKLTNPTS